MKSSPAPDAPPSGFATLDRRQVLFTVAGMMLTLLLAAMDQTIVGTAMPRVIASLNGFDRYPWVTTSYLLTSTLAVPIFAKLSDLYGRKWFYLAGVVVFIVSSWLCGSSGQVPLPLDGMNQLIVWRGLQGIGGGIIMGLTFTIVGDLFSPAERGKFQGMFGAVFALASVVGPVMGGWITDHLSWRWAFYVNAPLGLLAIAVLYFTFPYFRPQNVRRIIDWAGVATLCAWLVPLLLALTRVSEDGWTSPLVLGLLGAAALFLTIFVYVEGRAAEPLLPLTLFQNPSIALAFSAIFLLGIGMFGMFLYLPLFMQGVMGASAAESGSLFTPMVLTLIASSILAGQVIARTRRYKLLAVVASMVSTGAMLLLAGMDASTTRFQLVRNMVLAGMGFGLLQPVYTIAVQNAARREQLGIATASTQFFRSIGSTIGVAVFGSVLLGLYHQRFQALVPPGTPAGVLAPFGNPLQLFQQKAQLQNVFSHLPHGAEVLRKLMFGVQSGLTGALHVIFLLSAGVMALTVILNLMLRETPLLAGAPKLDSAPAE